MKLCVISHKRHWLREDKPVSSGGFVLEIDYWATMFDSVLLCVPLHKDEQPPKGAYGYRAPNVEIAPLPPFKANLPKRFVWRFRKSYRFLMNVVRFFKMLRAIRACDAVCVRCPGRASMTGLIAAILAGRRRCVRYGANWFPEEDESPSEARQKALLRGKLFKGPVLVHWYPDERLGVNVVPIFGSTITKADVEETRELAIARQLSSRPKLIFVGRLSKEKNVDVILEGIAALKSAVDSAGSELSFDICGDGDQRKFLEERATSLGLGSIVTFQGMIPHTALGENYKTADILLLASSTEGWPKVLIEAMLYGLPCIGTSVGSVPHIIGRNGERGMLWPVGRPELLAEAIAKLPGDRDLYKSMSRAARAWAETRTLERYRDEVRAVLEKAWRCELRRADVPPIASSCSER
ncbi:MAG: glycosyltransferase family 4 protein [Candidatus Coatesbacteria bacterium]|nr:glycosyltransferase family 4 protein [Candidatus Coatesbacteria bacterium]